MKYIIIDSNTNFAEKLKLKLENKVKDKNIYSILDNINSDIITKYKSILNDKDTTCTILINAETLYKDLPLQHQAILEIIFCFRSKLKFKGSIVIYSLFPTGFTLNQNINHLICFAPGCHYFQLPFTNNDIENIKNLPQMEDLQLINPFLKPKVDAIIALDRHTSANLASMNLMLNTITQIYDLDKESKVIHKTPLFSHRKSTDYHILAQYFGLEKLILNDIQKKALNPKSDKKIILIDDLAEQGWKEIISFMLYGEKNNTNLVTYSEYNFKELKNAIISHKPHLILLDLRLKDEKGLLKLEKISGFELLKELKKDSQLKGLPIIMFTATTNAETVKQLLNAGAEAVWTKPGLDEGLTTDGIYERYKSLLDLVDSLEKPDIRLTTNDNSETIDLESVRNTLLKRLEYIKFRLSLYSDEELLKLLPNPLKDIKYFYFDSNALMTGTNRLPFYKNLEAFYTLSLITSKGKLNELLILDETVNLNSKDTTKLPHFIDITTPKVVIMNVIYDELIKLAKTTNKKSSVSSQRSSLVVIVLKELFSNNYIRTEFSRKIYQNQKAFISDLKNPKENVYGDPFIIDEMLSILIPIKKDNYTYKTDSKIYLISEDKDLTTKLDSLKQTNLSVKKLEDFTQLIADIKL